MYMLDMLNTFCDLLSGLLEDVVKEGEQGSVTLVPWKDFTLQGHYQSKARLHTLDLFSNVYLLEMLLSIAESACKKVCTCVKPCVCTVRIHVRISLLYVQ